MDRDVLLDAIGMVDDRFLTEEKVFTFRPLRRFVALVAALVAVLALALTAMAVSDDFREIIFSIFCIETREDPPVQKPTASPSSETGEPQPNLREMGIKDIDGEVKAFYFSSEGYVMPGEGGFYTCDWTEYNATPSNPAFWEITQDGIVEAEGTRVDFSFTHGGKTFQIIFDYAVLNGKLSIRVWPKGLNEDPIGNGWNVTEFFGRTDVALMSIPVDSGLDYTHDYFLLDLETLEAAMLLESSAMEDMMVDACWFSEELRYAIVSGWIPSKQESEMFLLDLQKQILTPIDEMVEHELSSTPYFLDNETIICWELAGDDRINVVRYHIPTQMRTVLVEDVARDAYKSVQHSGWRSVYGLIDHGDGNYELVDLRSNERLAMSGLTGGRLRTSESPNGERVMLSFQNYSSLGILDPGTGVLKVLNRNPPADVETFWGWLDETTVALTNHDENNGYFVYIYRFG